MRMNLLEIKLDCDQTTSHQKLTDKFGKIRSSACKNQTIHGEQCFSRELMLRNKIELDLDKNLEDE
ncbi:hypothetical protein BpHYR1_002246 [Brachionus plicatilis]|uniref:Uncharacterized protein n=1 Tax=Brachionus plicatilis TaxID=10195 RepID=A0A3M7S5C4_BRAPC|nr:hypothetical protein BpHYR1_002246 [Brachionus plicatilis]